MVSESSESVASRSRLLLARLGVDECQSFFALILSMLLLLEDRV